MRDIPNRLDEALVWEVARELARDNPHVRADPKLWGEISLEYHERAREKINAMTNLELIRALGDYLAAS